MKTATFPEQCIEVVNKIPDALINSQAEAVIVEEIMSSGLDVVDSPSSGECVVFKMTTEQMNKLLFDWRTPTHNETTSQKERPLNRFSACVLALSASIGTPMSIQDVREGAVVQDIFPAIRKANQPDSSYGSLANFEFHNDQSYLDEPDIPSHFSLGCIRNIERAVTLFTNVKAIKDRLDTYTIAELELSNFIFRHTYNRGSEDEYESKKTGAVLHPNGEIRLGVDMELVSEADALALDLLIEQARLTAEPHVFEPGEVVVVPNRFNLHGRQPFEMHINPSYRRWLQRVNIC